MDYQKMKKIGEFLNDMKKILENQEYLNIQIESLTKRIEDIENGL
jgi:hypothetical protein